MPGAPVAIQYKESVNVAAGAATQVFSIAGGTAITVYVDAKGLAAVAGAVVRLWGWCGDIRARVGADAKIAVGGQQKIVSQRGWGVEKWDVEIVGGPAPVAGLSVAAATYGTDP